MIGAVVSTAALAVIIGALVGYVAGYGHGYKFASDMAERRPSREGHR